ncbi:MAG TPA: N-acetyl-gamma-glutamyl-phosphate reductase [Ktedonobacteraceae bacterium]
MITVSIVNVTSYTGLELLRLLAGHPEFVVTSVTARSAAGQRLDEVFPQLAAGLNHDSSNVGSLLLTEKPAQTDLAFVCLPHAAAAETVVELLAQGIKVVDLSADFRLRNVATYEKWYQHTHPAPALLETAVYGLSERYRARIATASLVANPGCHASTAILALLPALAMGLIKPDIIVNSLTGMSGAGRGLKLGSLFCEQDEDVSAYSLGGHRHLPEIVQELEAAARDGGHTVEGGLRLTFVPHYIPMSRGLLATCYADIKDPSMSIEEVRAVYADYYAHEPFIRVIDTAPHTRWTTGTNLCLIHPTLDRNTGRLMVVSCLDNLVKGAAGAAVQNANLLVELPETAGLPTEALMP